jgi:hypothetical protein
MPNPRPYPPQPPATAVQSLLQPQYTLQAGLSHPTVLGRPNQTGQTPAAAKSSSGLGVPNSTTPGATVAGSVWFRSNGTTNNRLYISDGKGGWTPVPGF